MYNRSLDIHANVRSKDALSYLEDFREGLRRKEDGFDDTDVYLVKLFDGKKLHIFWFSYRIKISVDEL